MQDNRTISADGERIAVSHAGEPEPGGKTAGELLLLNAHGSISVAARASCCSDGLLSGLWRYLFARP